MNGSQIQITSADDFVCLRRSSNPNEYGIAANGWAEEYVWVEVIERFPDMKEWVIHNKQVPISILELLAKDGDPDDRRRIADKRKLTRELFELLAEDPSAGVRYSIATNPKVPTDLLDSLCQDPEDWVREEALEIRAKRTSKNP